MVRTLNEEICAVLPFSNCTDFQFYMETGAKCNFDFDKAETNEFFREISEYTSTFSDNNFTCQYYDEQKFNSTFPNNLHSQLKAYHLNIRSFELHQFELAGFLECLNTKFDIIILTECGFISQPLIEREFSDFELYADTPKLKKGGVGILIRKNIFSGITPLDNQEEFTFSNCQCNKCVVESKFLKLKSNEAEIVVGGIYRHPNGNPDHFNKEYSRIIENIPETAVGIIGGDINLNLLDYDKKFIRDYTNITMENNFVPCITLPTRITSTSATIIDHIMLKLPKNKLHSKVQSGNFSCNISDHLPNFIIVDLAIKNNINRPFIRIFSPNKIKEFNDSLSYEMNVLDQRLNQILNTNDVNSIYAEFFTQYKNLLDKYFPKVKMSRKKAKDKPWISAGIKTSIKKRNILFKQYHAKKSDENEKKWKSYRNNLVTVIRAAETIYYKNLINKHNNDCTAMWKVFGKILKNKTSSTKVIKLKHQGKTIHNAKDISETFNNFFTNIGESLAKEFSNTNEKAYTKYMNTKITKKFNFSFISTEEISKEINNLKNKKSNGHDDIPAIFIKLTKDHLAKQLSKMFNLSIQNNIYPSQLKIAKVSPIFKNGDSQLANNYRPISVLTHINKIFEKVLFSRLSSFLFENKILFDYQFGFREGHSTTQALIELTDNLKSAIDDGKFSCGIFIDLTKAFDTVNHSILIEKLDNYGISGNSNKLMKSYLDNRFQYVDVNNTKSSCKRISCGVPQGSVLGPLLFLLYINDLPNCSKLGNFRIFADDTAIFFYCDDPNQLSNKIVTIMNHVSDWFSANKLTLNLKKSNFCVFRSVNNKNKQFPDTIAFKNKEITRISHVKYLGIHLDEHLNFSYHINEICKSLRKLFPIFYNIRRYLNSSHIKSIYYSMVYSKIKYGILTYGLTTSTNIKKIQVVQNKLLKVISNQKYRTPTNALHNSLELLKVKDIFTQELLTFVHKFKNKKLPNVFRNYFRKFDDVHNINTRNKENFIVPRFKTVFGSKVIKYFGAVTWNSLNHDIKNIRNVKSFRLKWKQMTIPY